MILEIFKKILTNFIFFIEKLQRNLEMIFNEVITNFKKKREIDFMKSVKEF